MTLLEKTWTRVGYPEAKAADPAKGTPAVIPQFSFELRRPTRLEKRGLEKLILPAIGKMNSKKLEGKSQDERNEAAWEMWEVLTEEKVLDIFHKYVRGVVGYEVDGRPVTTSQALLEYAEDDFVLHVLTSLLRYGQLGEEEGKGSSSPSTSSPAPTESGPSAATSIESEGGTRPSTAEPIPADSESSGRAAEA